MFMSTTHETCMADVQTQLPSTPPPKRDGRSRGLIQAYELRQLAHELAMKLASGEAREKESKVARDITGLIRAWAEADDRVRIHRGKPLPGTLRPTSKPKRSRQPSLGPVTEPTPTPQSVV